MFLTSLENRGPKHSISVLFRVLSAVPLNVDEKKPAFVPNPDSDVTMKVLPGPHKAVTPTVLCGRAHSLLPFTLQMVIPFLSPVTVHLKLKVLPGQVGGGAVNCPKTLPGEETVTIA